MYIAFLLNNSIFSLLRNNSNIASAVLASSGLGKWSKIYNSKYLSKYSINSVAQSKGSSGE